MAWRNDPRTLAASFHREPKRWSSFWPEYRNTYFNRPDLTPHFICLEEKEPIAFVRYVPSAAESRVLDISLNLAPAFRGRRLAAPVLDRSLAFLRARPFEGSILALVRAENQPSHRSFLAAGFREIDRVQHQVVDTGESCSVIRLRFAMTDGRNEDEIRSEAHSAAAATGLPR